MVYIHFFKVENINSETEKISDLIKKVTEVMIENGAVQPVIDKEKCPTRYDPFFDGDLPMTPVYIIGENWLFTCEDTEGFFDKKGSHEIIIAGTDNKTGQCYIDLLYYLCGTTSLYSIELSEKQTRTFDASDLQWQSLLKEKPFIMEILKETKDKEVIVELG